MELCGVNIMMRELPSSTKEHDVTVILTYYGQIEKLNELKKKKIN